MKEGEKTSMNETLEFKYAPCGRSGSVILTLSHDGNVIVVEKVDVSKSNKRKEFVDKCCGDFAAIDESELEACLLKVAAEVAETTASSKGKGKEDIATTKEPIEVPEELRLEAEAMLADPRLMERIIDDVAALGVAGERELIAAAYLCGTSRLLGKPLSMIVQGPSSSGKSYVVDKVACCFPPEAVVAATQLTPQALFYMEPGSLRHKFVVVGERSRLENDDTAEATRALREMLSSGRLSKIIPMKGVDGQLRSVRVEQEGPISYVESTTLTQVFDEDANRSILMSTDERDEQTQRIVKHVATACSGSQAVIDRDRIVARHQAAQRLLQQVDVVVPFSPRLAELFQSRRVEARRAFTHLVSLIQTSALLHQRQRETTAEGAVIATVDDYRIAKGLLSKPLTQQLGGGVSNATERFLERMMQRGRAVFTTTEAAKQEGGQFSARSVRSWLAEAHEAGRLEMLSASIGPRPASWQLVQEVSGDAAPSILPHVDLLRPPAVGVCQQTETPSVVAA